MENKMQEVAQLLGAKLDEEFLDEYGFEYKISKQKEVRIYCHCTTNCSEQGKKTCCQQCKHSANCKRVCHNNPAICGWEKSRNVTLARKHLFRGRKQ